jgi:hypothetical protein
LITGYFKSFARVQARLTRAANVGVGVATIVHEELTALAAHSSQFDAGGPDVELSLKAAGTMTLAVHELTTDALNMVRSRFLTVRSLFAGRLSKSRADSG